MPEGGVKDTVSKACSQIVGAARPCCNTRLEGGGDLKRETIFIMEQRSLSGKRNYGQTVATA